MKNLFFIIMALLVFSWTMADEIYLSRDNQTTDIRIIQDKFSSRDKASLLLECHIHSMLTEEVETPNGTFTRLYIPGWQHTNNPGEPELPMLARIIEVPLGGKVEVTLLSSQKLEVEAKTYKMSSILPHQPSVRRDQKEVPFLHNKDSYQVSFSRSDIVTVEEIGMMRSSRLVMVKYTPVEYSPVDGKFIFHNNIKVEVSVENADIAGTIQLKEKYDTPIFGFAKGKVLTPASLNYLHTSKRSTGYLIVAHKMFEATLQPFIEHKKSMGYEVAVCYFKDKPTVVEVQDVVLKEYKKNAPVFLLIVGDVDQIPAQKTSNCYTDLYFHSVLSGGSTDYIPDMLCGRFSANNDEELATQIERTIAYEQIDRNNRPEYLNKYALVSGWDSSWAVKRGYPQIRYSVKYYFNENNNYVKPILGGPERNVFLTTKSGDSVKDIVSLVANGVGFFNYTAHGSQTDFSDPNFTMANIDSLPEGIFPLVVGNCCLTGSLQVGTCFGEKWLRAKNKGAIGYIGGSTYTYWDEDLYFGVGLCTLDANVNSGNAPSIESTGVGMYEVGFGVFTLDNQIPENFKITCNAAIMYAGNMAVQASSSSRKKYYFEVYHLFGDPSVPCLWAHK